MFMLCFIKMFEETEERKLDSIKFTGGPKTIQTKEIQVLFMTRLKKIRPPFSRLKPCLKEVLDHKLISCLI